MTQEGAKVYGSKHKRQSKSFTFPKCPLIGPKGHKCNARLVFVVFKVQSVLIDD